MTYTYDEIEDELSMCAYPPLTDMLRQLLAENERLREELDAERRGKPAVTTDWAAPRLRRGT